MFGQNVTDFGRPTGGVGQRRELIKPDDRDQMKGHDDSDASDTSEEPHRLPITSHSQQWQHATGHSAVTGPDVGLIVCRRR